MVRKRAQIMFSVVPESDTRQKPPAPLLLVPYHQLFDERYVVYWRVFRKDSPEYERYQAAEAARLAAW